MRVKKIRTLAPAVRTLNSFKSRPGGSHHLRKTGDVLIARRLNMWKKEPHCKSCGVLVDYPHGFHLDHIIPLSEGGADTEDNCQVLCVWYDDQGKMQGCHADKSRAEASGRAQ